jgi:hypothetical protein
MWSSQAIGVAVANSDMAAVLFCKMISPKGKVDPKDPQAQKRAFNKG